MMINDQADDDDAMRAGERLDLMPPLRFVAPQRQQRRAIGGDRAAAGADQPADVGEDHRGAERGMIGEQRRPLRDERIQRAQHHRLPNSISR